jgi:uncharacterized delta-60 repeat protein
VTTPIGSRGGYVTALALQPDGRVVAAGFSGNGSRVAFAVVRYNANGTLDASFGSGGKVTTPIGPTSAYAYALALQGDGKIVLAGRSSDGSIVSFTLVRYEANGTLDASFGQGGKVTTPTRSVNDSLSALAVQRDGKLVAAGSTSNGLTDFFALLRYSADGTLDRSFGKGGKVATPIGTGDAQASALVLGKDGKLVVAGFSVSGSTVDFALARYNR